MRPSSNFVRSLALAAVLAMLGGCSEYLDRRDTIALSGGNAVATNKVTHMVDPWPRDSANRDIAFNGAKMETAIERYRTNKVIPPRAAPAPPAPTRRRPWRQNNMAGRPDRDPAGGAGEIAGSLTSCVSAVAPAQTARKVVVLTADEEFNRSARDVWRLTRDRTQHGVGPDRRSGRRARGRRRHRRGGRSRCRSRRRDADAVPADGARRRLAAGDRGHAGLRRERRPHAAADAHRRLPGEAGGADRSGARLRPRRQGSGRQCGHTDRSADLHFPARGRRRRRHHAGGADRHAAAQQRRPARQAVDLPGRSRFPAWLGRRLSRSRAASQSGGDRAAAGPSRPAIAGSHALYRLGWR